MNPLVDALFNDSPAAAELIRRGSPNGLTLEAKTLLYNAQAALRTVESEFSQYKREHDRVTSYYDQEQGRLEDEVERLQDREKQAQEDLARVRGILEEVHRVLTDLPGVNQALAGRISTLELAQGVAARVAVLSAGLPVEAPKAAAATGRKKA